MFMTDIINVQNLKKQYGEKVTVNSINFTIKKGEVFGILGPNGAGKTTTLEMIEGMRPIDGGSATIDGINVSEDPWSVRRIIGVQPQQPAFQDKQKLTEIIELFAATYGEKVNA